MKISDELAIRAAEELAHALQIANHVDYLSGMPSVVPKPLQTSERRKKCSNSTWKTSVLRIANYQSGDPSRRIKRIRHC
jgi:bacterioferritin